MNDLDSYSRKRFGTQSLHALAPPGKTPTPESYIALMKI